MTGEPCPGPQVVRGGGAEAVVGFYGLGAEAEHEHEYRLMLHEIDQLLALADQWSDRRFEPTFRVLELMAEEIIGSRDPYWLVMRYRQVCAGVPHHVVRSVDDLEMPPRAMSSWSNFDVAEYIRRNYFGEREDGRWLPEEGSWRPGRFRQRIIKHDRVLIDAIYQLFAEFGVCPGEFTDAIDIGSSGNLYPAMVLTPMIESAAVVTRQIYQGNPGELGYARAMHGGDGIYHYCDRYGVRRSVDTRAPWAAFATLIERAGSRVYPGFSARFRGTVEAVLARSEIITGDIFDFAVSAPPRRFDVAASFFVHDSISFDPTTSWQAVDCVVNAAARFVVIGQVLNSPIDGNGGGRGGGYTAGGGTFFPNTAYSRGDWETYLEGHPRVRRYRIVESRDELGAEDRFSDREEGLALIMAELSPPPDRHDEPSTTEFTRKS